MIIISKACLLHFFVKNTFIGDIMSTISYSGFTIRYARLCSWIEKKEEDSGTLIARIISQLDRLKPEIEKKLNISFSSCSSIQLTNGKLGQYIEYPTFIFKLLGVELIAMLRINPCLSFIQNDKQGKNSKIWVVLKNNKEEKLNGSQINSILDESKSICLEATKILGEHYISCIKDTPEKISDYWTSIESVAIDTKNISPEEYNQLFEPRNKEEFIFNYANSPFFRNSLLDLANWISTKDIKDPLQYIIKNKGEGQIWKILSEQDAQVFYSEENRDDYFRVVGVGVNSNKLVSDNKSVDLALMPKLSTLISTL